ncbi:MAG: metallopeptidase TldD-related protein [Candidatus Hecatellaceae archaeon]
MEDLLAEAVDCGRRLGASLVEVRGENSWRTLITVKDGRVEVSREGFEQGVGVRVLADGAWGYASTPRLSREAVLEAVEKAYRLARAVGLRVKEPIRLAETRAERVKTGWKIKEPPLKFEVEGKAELALELNRKLLKADSRVKSSTVDYLDLTVDSWFWNSEGAEIFQRKVYVWLRANVSAFEAGTYGSAAEETGATRGMEHFEGERLSEMAERLIGRVKGQLRAVQPKGGIYPAVIGPSVVGVFAHESLGHMAEADLALSGSILLQEMGRQIASEKVTIYDDGSIEGAFGSMIYDDEGVRAGRVTILKEGVVVGLLHSRETAGKLQAQPTGNARAENFRHTPLVRMRNTFMAPGDHSLEELLEPIEFGYYLKTLRGGQVNMDGTFQVGVQEAYEIVKGEIGRPVRNLSIAGNTLETLKGVEAVGKDFELWPGRCGKGQTVFVSDGGPTIRVKAIRVGGRV